MSDCDHYIAPMCGEDVSGCAVEADSEICGPECPEYVRAVSAFEGETPLGIALDDNPVEGIDY